jgi:CDP-glycerol glycerophosphotransferase (TagB/SpsB family)
LALEQNVEVCLLAHPNVAPFLTVDTVPDHVRLLDWSSVKVQEELARCHMLLTDYSSVAFDVALLGKQTVYFQFDEAAFFAGSQPFRRGYFEYRRDGFGPVATSVPECLEQIRDIAESGFAVAQPYDGRIESTFTLKDGNACSRVYQAIRGLDRVHRPVTLEPGAVEEETVAS